VWKRLSLSSARGVHLENRDLSLAVEGSMGGDSDPTSRRATIGTQRLRSWKIAGTIAAYEAATRKGLDAAIRDIEVHAQALLSPFLPIAVHGELLLPQPPGFTRSMPTRNPGPAVRLEHRHNDAHKEYASPIEEWIIRHVATVRGVFFETQSWDAQTDGKHVLCLWSIWDPPYHATISPR